MYGVFTSEETNKPQVRNTVLFGNDTGIRAGTGAASAPDSDYNCFYGNTTDYKVASTSVTLATIQGGGKELNSQHADPQFINANGDYSASPPTFHDRCPGHHAEGQGDGRGPGSRCLWHGLNPTH